MTNAEAIKYWCPVRKKIHRQFFYGENSEHSASIRLAAALGFSYPSEDCFREIELTEELERALTILNGPHWLTVLKMLEARRKHYMPSSQDRIESVYAKLGKLIAERREELGLSQSALAKRIGLSRPTLGNMELGSQRIPLHRMIMIEKALGYPATYIITKVFKHGKPRIRQVKRTVQGLPNSSH